LDAQRYPPLRSTLRTSGGKRWIAGETLRGDRPGNVERKLDFSDSPERLTIKALFDPKATRRAQSVQLGAQPVDFPFQLGTNQNSYCSSLIQSEPIRDSPCFRLVEKNQSHPELDCES
jgi:hypothetical protein